MCCWFLFNFFQKHFYIYIHTRMYLWTQHGIDLHIWPDTILCTIHNRYEPGSFRCALLYSVYCAHEQHIKIGPRNPKNVIQHKSQHRTMRAREYHAVTRQSSKSTYAHDLDKRRPKHISFCTFAYLHFVHMLTVYASSQSDIVIENYSKTCAVATATERLCDYTRRGELLWTDCLVWCCGCYLPHTNETKNT